MFVPEAGAALIRTQQGGWDDEGQEGQEGQERRSLRRRCGYNGGFERYVWLPNTDADRACGLTRDDPSWKLPGNGGRPCLCTRYGAEYVHSRLPSQQIEKRWMPCEAADLRRQERVGGMQQGRSWRSKLPQNFPAATGQAGFLVMFLHIPMSMMGPISSCGICRKLLQYRYRAKKSREASRKHAKQEYRRVRLALTWRPLAKLAPGGAWPFRPLRWGRAGAGWAFHVSPPEAVRSYEVQGSAWVQAHRQVPNSSKGG